MNHLFERRRGLHTPRMRRLLLLSLPMSVRSGLALAAVALVASGCTSARGKLRAAVRPSAIERSAPPLPAKAIDVGFVAGAGRIHATWIDGDLRALRVMSFDGTAWGATESIATDVDLEAAAGRKPVLTVQDDGRRIAHWFDRRDGQRSAFYSVSETGSTEWSAPVGLPPAVGDGFGALAWVHGAPPRAAWIAPWKQPLRPAADALFLGIPDREDPRVLRTGVVEPRVASAAGIDVLPLSGGFYVSYLAPTFVEEPGFLVAFRKLGPINSSQSDVGYVEVVWVPSDGRSVVIYGGGGDRLRAGGRAGRTQLFRRGEIPWIAWYTPKGGGELRTFPLLVKPLLARNPSGISGRKYLCLDRVDDFRVDEAEGELGIVSLEGGHVMLRRGSRIERLTDAPLADGSRLEWLGHLGTRRFIAWVESPGRLVFGEIPAR